MAKGTLQIEYEKLVMVNLELNERIEELKTALRKYSDHLGACYKNLKIGDCNCGFEQALKGGK